MISINGKSSNDFDLVVKTTSYPLLPNRRNQEIEVIGRDGTYHVKGALTSKTISFRFTHQKSSIKMRKDISRNIAAWLNSAKELILDYEPHKKWIVTDVTAPSETLISSYDEFDVSFIVHPLQQATQEMAPAIPWNQITTPWNSWDVPWNGLITTNKSFTINNSQTITLKNGGTYKALPKIIITGTSSQLKLALNNKIAVINNITGTTVVDCNLMLVYQQSGDSKINHRNNFDGDYIELEPGDNNVVITVASGSSLNITFDYNDTFI